MDVSATNPIQYMSSYPLRYHEDVAKFLNVLGQLIDIYQTESPKFFRQCVENIPIDIYDKIIELNGSKIKSRYWSADYIQCISMSKKIVAAITYVEKSEYRRYQAHLINYEHHYGDTMIDNYTITMTLPIEFDNT